MSDKIAEIRARHQEGIRAGADADRAYLLAEVDRLRAFEAAHRQLQAALDVATRERDEARAEVERLRDEDTKTRHALRGWVWVCPDGGDEPTHERVSAVVAEVERLTRERNEARAWAAKLLATLEMARDADNDCRVEGWATIPDAVRRSIDEALEAKP